MAGRGQLDQPAVTRRKARVDHVTRTKERARPGPAVTEDERRTLLGGSQPRRADRLDVDLETIVERGRRQPARETLVERALLVRFGAEGGQLVDQRGRDLLARNERVTQTRVHRKVEEHAHDVLADVRPSP